MNKYLRAFLARQSRLMEENVDADGQGKNAGGNGAEPTEAEKAAAATAAAAAAAEAAKASTEAKGDKPSDAEAKLLKEVMQKKELLKVAQDEAAAAKARLAEFDGVDAAEIKKLLADKRTAEEAALVAKGDFDTLKARMAEEHTNATATLKETIAALQAQLSQKDGVVNELSIGSQFAQSQFIANESTMAPAKARKLYGDHFDVVDGKVVSYDKPRGEANRQALVDQYGNGMDFEASMRKIVDADPDKATLLRSGVKPGAGSQSKDTTKVNANAGIKDLDAIGKIASGMKGLNLMAEGKIA